MMAISCMRTCHPPRPLAGPARHRTNAGRRMRTRSSTARARMQVELSSRWDGVVWWYRHECTDTTQPNQQRFYQSRAQMLTPHTRHTTQDEPQKFSYRAFFMMLRRMGYKPLNKAAPPATSGLDYGLRNRAASMQGYVHDPAVFDKYCTRRHLRNSSTRVIMPDDEGAGDPGAASEGDGNGRQEETEQGREGSDVSTAAARADAQQHGVLMPPK